MAGGCDDEVLEVSCGDPGAYAAVLKRKLDLYCAAVAKSMETKSQDSSLGYPNSQASDTSQLISQASDTSQLISQASDTSLLISQASFDGDGDEASFFTNSHITGNSDSLGNPASTGISKEQSEDDDDLEEPTKPANAKKMRRMLSNRESARRSRKRKQTHLDDLESQVSSLTAENASLLKRLVDMTQKYKDATLDNQHLIADVEMMRRKVHVAEEAVRRVTGASMLLPPSPPTTSNMPVTSSTPLMTSCASDAPSVVAVDVQEGVERSVLQSPPLPHGNNHQAKLDLLPNATTFRLDSGENNMVSTTAAAVSLRRFASLENLQKRIHNDSVRSGTTALPLSSDPEAPPNDGDS